MPGSRMFRLIVASILGVCAVPVVAASGASAALRGVSPYRTVITGISPTVSGIRVEVDPAGAWIQVTNTTRRLLIVQGYMHEPYLRIDRHGVHANMCSPSAAVDAGTTAGAYGAACAGSAVRWQTRTAGCTVRWPDQRIRWSGSGRPQGVETPQETLRLATWAVMMIFDGRRRLVVHGTVDWLGDASSNGETAEFVVYAVDTGAMVVVVLSILAYTRRRRRRLSASTLHPPRSSRTEKSGSTEGSSGYRSPWPRA